MPPLVLIAVLTRVPLLSCAGSVVAKLAAARVHRLYLVNTLWQPRARWPLREVIAHLPDSALFKYSQICGELYEREEWEGWGVLERAH